MDKCREAFEKWYEFEHGEKVYWSDMPLHQVYLFSAWQEQQKRIDELQSRVDAVLKIVNEESEEIDLSEYRINGVFVEAGNLIKALKGVEV